MTLRLAKPGDTRAAAALIALDGANTPAGSAWSHLRLAPIQAPGSPCSSSWWKVTSMLMCSRVVLTSSPMNRSVGR